MFLGGPPQARMPKDMGVKSDLLVVWETRVRLVGDRLQCCVNVLPREALPGARADQRTWLLAAYVVKITVEGFAGFRGQENTACDFPAFALNVEEVLRY